MWNTATTAPGLHLRAAHDDAAPARWLLVLIGDCGLHALDPLRRGALELGLLLSADHDGVRTGEHYGLATVVRPTHRIRRQTAGVHSGNRRAPFMLAVCATLHDKPITYIRMHLGLPFYVSAGTFVPRLFRFKSMPPTTACTGA
jgi:hypothetical protein